MQFEPMHHFVHIERVEIEALKKTLGGIILPDNLQAHASVFRVVAAGPGFFDAAFGGRVPMEVKPGDYVLVDVREGADVNYAGKSFTIVPESAIYGKMHFEVAEASES